MTRPVSLCLLAALAAGLTGCLDEFLDRDDLHVRNKPIETPKLPEASQAAAARVDQVGRDLLAATPFLGLDPTFYTDARAVPLLGHPDFKGVIISEGLVNKCKSDAELAALLATEVARMAAEKRAADRSRPDPPRDVPAGATSRPGSIGSDELPLTETGIYLRTPHPAPGGPPAADTGPVPTAADLLRAAGFADKDLDAVAPLLKEAAGNRKLAAGLGPKPAEPRWSP